MKTYVLYHGNCFDGMGAAWAAWRYYGEHAHHFIPVSYGQPPPEMASGSSIDIIDFSYPRSVIEELIAQHASVTILDHHATAEKDLTPWPVGLLGKFDMNRSGAGIAWDWYHTGEPRPSLIDYLEDRDLWRFALPLSREISAVVKTVPFTFTDYELLYQRLHDQGVTAVGAIGRELLVLINQQVAVICNQARRCDTLGTLARVPYTNASVFFSEVGDELLKRNPESEVAAYYFDRADGRRQWGLRSRPGFDCSVIAKQFGGGGHPTASGFTTEIGWLP